MPKVVSLTQEETPCYVHTAHLTCCQIQTCSFTPAVVLLLVISHLHKLAHISPA